MEYLILLVFFLLTALFLDYKYKIKLYDSRKERILIPIIFFILAVIWDYFAVFIGHWSYGGPGLIGINIGLLPLEDYLFFLIVPYVLLTYYKVLKKEIK